MGNKENDENERCGFPGCDRYKEEMKAINDITDGLIKSMDSINIGVSDTDVNIQIVPPKEMEEKVLGDISISEEKKGEEEHSKTVQETVNQQKTVDDSNADDVVNNINTQGEI